MRSLSISYIALFAALGLASGVPAGAAAQDLGDDKPVLLDEITLTASGQPLELSRTGASVTVLTEKDIETAGDVSLANQLARLPGVSMTRNGGVGTSTALRLRGLGPAYIGVRIDGIDVADPSGTQCSYDFGSTTSANVSRLEVLRGSQSALYGSEAIGGVVDITTYRPTEDGLTARTSVEVGSAKSRSVAASVGLRQDRVELAFSASHVATDGISAYAYGTEKDGFRANMLSFYGAYDLTDDIRVGVNGFLRDSYTEFDSQTADNAETENGRLRGARAFVEAKFGDTTHELSYARVTTLREYPLGWVTRYDGDREQLKWTGNWSNGGPVSVNWGLDHSTESFAAGTDAGEVTTDAAYGEVLWAATPDLDLSFALRRDDHETFGGKTSGRIAAAWRPTEAWTLRAVASTGFRAPSLYELYSAYGNRDLKPETSRSFELGAEYSFGDVGSAQVTLFDTEIDDKINFGYNRYEQVPGQTRTRGAEIVGRYALSSDWELFGNYTYTDAYAINDGVKTAAVRVPRHDLALGIEGAITDKLTARGSLHHVADFSDLGIWPAPASKMPDYTVVNVGLGYAINDRAEAWLRVENLFDEEYQTVRNYGQPGRQVFVGVGARF